MQVPLWRKNFKFLRERKFKNQTELASILGASQQTITNWEKGIGAPKLEKFLQITKIFGISFEEMMENDIEKAEMYKAEIGVPSTKNEIILPEKNLDNRNFTGSYSSPSELTEHLEEIVQLQKQYISSLEKRITDKALIESMLKTDCDRLKGDLEKYRKNK